jgi:exodeoxyribonuclease V gamma subunit
MNTPLPPDHALQLYRSNRLENLFTALCELIAAPPADPLAPEIIIVQNPGMARWLAQNIAKHSGIAANLNFPLPASFFWDVFQKTLGDLPDVSCFDRKTLAWRILAELDELLHLPDMETLAGYLSDDPDGTKKFQLAEKITDIFDQYLVYRPKMLLDWEKGTDHHWQAALWKKLTQDNNNHRAALLKQLLTAEQTHGLRTDALPQRVSFFGINALAPAYMEIVKALQRVLDIHIFHLSPCQQAWDDILPRRLLAIKRQEWRNKNQEDISHYFTSGNPLLASMGAMGQEFFSLLMGLDPVEHELYQHPDESTLLGGIQSDILRLKDRTAADDPTLISENDHSLSFHCCHSPMREVQVLHDRLLDFFAADDQLRPSDILVMAPDINSYAPFVNGIFGAAKDTLRIPWSIADQNIRSEQSIIEGFITLLDALTGRFTAPEIIAFFENSSICQSFDLAESDLPIMRRFIRKAGIRWGLDNKQRDFNLAGNDNLYTWKYGLDRLLMGYITGQQDTTFLDILPCAGGHTGAVSWLGGLAEFISRLQTLHTRCRHPLTAADWATTLHTLLDDFFDTTADSNAQDGLLLLREKVTAFAEHCARAKFTEKLHLHVIRHHFNTLLAEPAGGQAFLAGKVTFCNMVPMRSVPFKIIYLLGMNDTAYPRTSRAPSFDLISRKPQLGDRSRRDDDRYLFLECLLSARSHLAVSWVGRDLQTNHPLPVSVVVGEVRDYLDRGWQTEDNTTTISELLTTEHPLQPFSHRCFSNDPEIQSYARLWLPEVEKIQKNIFFDTPLPQPETTTREINLNELLRFWNHPVQYFLEKRFSLALRSKEQTLPESEPFSLDTLQSYIISNTLVGNILEKQHNNTLFQQLIAEAEFPAGTAGDICRENLLTMAQDLLAALDDFVKKPAEPQQIELKIEDFRLTGTLSSLYEKGFASYRPANCKGNDLLRLWINHLVLNLIRPEGVALSSCHAGKDKRLFLSPVKHPQKELLPLLQYFLQGQQEPLHFYPKSSYAWARAKEKDRMNKARSCWYSRYNYFGVGEEDHLAYTIALRGIHPLDPAFEDMATLFLPILAMLEEKNCASA